ncbi:diacylglycerol kinase [Ideonella benzenivorans]|uniref:diacylglycerol kinase n=1 Tax=Ideonella benzenivorans TaxID=2831643 RepID=UPI001CED8201|nr:diacylglycerol kinase [Ideonella benzenivorans]
MTPPFPRRTGLSRILHAFGYSLAGLRSALLGESAFRQEAVLAVVLLPASFWLGDGWVEVGLLAGSVILVLVVELLNTAVESTIDRIGPERHELSGRAKDLGSAAVLLSLLLAAGLWAGAFWQHFMRSGA